MIKNKDRGKCERKTLSHLPVCAMKHAQNEEIMDKKIIFATSNEGKMKEIRILLEDLGVDVLSLKEAGIHADIEENGTTFEENAMIKAKTICELSSCLVLADDSGLEVDYMDRSPGVYSARFMGEETSYSIKNKAIIDKLSKAVDSERSARFVCVIAAVFPDGRVMTTKGTMEGLIAYEPAGDNGFGYDPILFIPQYEKTCAQLTMEQKNKISHRGKALRAMKEQLKKSYEENYGDESTGCK